MLLPYLRELPTHLSASSSIPRRHATCSLREGTECHKKKWINTFLSNKKNCDNYVPSRLGCGVFTALARETRNFYGRVGYLTAMLTMSTPYQQQDRQKSNSFSEFFSADDRNHVLKNGFLEVPKKNTSPRFKEIDSMNFRGSSKRCKRTINMSGGSQVRQATSFATRALTEEGIQR
jgi:hypothetical protein